jgi:hypothetical protein
MTVPGKVKAMISGAHMIIYSTDADADRAFFRMFFGFRQSMPARAG